MIGYVFFSQSLSYIVNAFRDFVRHLATRTSETSKICEVIGALTNSFYTIS